MSTIKDFVIDLTSYYQEDYIDFNYFDEPGSYSALSAELTLRKVAIEFAADLTTQASIELTATRIHPGVVASNSVATTSIIATHVKGLEAELDVVTQQIASAELAIIKDFVIDLTSYYQEDYIDFNYFDEPGSYSALSAELTLQNLSIEFAADLTTQASIELTATRIHPGVSASNSVTTTSIIATHVKGLEAEFAASAEQIAQPTRILDFEIETEALFTPTVIASATINAVATLDSVSDLTATASKFTGYESLQSYFAALNAQAARTREFDTELAVQGSTSVDTARFRETDSELAVFVTATTDSTRVRTASIDVTSTATIAANAGLIKGINSGQVAAAELTADNTRTRNSDAQLFANGGQLVAVTVIKTSVVEVAIVSAVTAVPTAIRNVSVNTQIQTTLFAAISVNKQLAAVLTSDFALTGTISQLAISAELTHRISREYRLYTVPKETRSYKIVNENRTYSIGR